MQAFPLPLRGLRQAALLLAALGATLPVFAQSGSSASSSGSWWQPASGQASVGLNLGRSKYHVPCGSALYGCDDRDRYVSLYGRTMSNDMWGGELALLHMGRIDRGGGTTRAYGLNLSLVGKAAMPQGLGVFGKVGAILGHTRTSVAANSGLDSGNKSNLGLSVGAGISWDFSPTMSAVLEWDRYQFKFAGTGRDAVSATSIGLQFRY